MKYCIQCKKLMGFECFYKHPKMKDGHLGKCKQCCVAYAKDRRTKNPQTVRSIDRQRSRSPERRAWVAEFQREQRKTNPDKYAARTAVANAIRDGRLQRQPCSVCGVKKAEAHHPNYSKPLDVVWLCFEHHRMEHSKIKESECISSSY
jgi:hypothetical protein